MAVVVGVWAHAGIAKRTWHNGNVREAGLWGPYGTVVAYLRLKLDFGPNLTYHSI